MLDLETARTVAARELDAFIACLGDEQHGDHVWSRPVRCVGWRVANLAGHVAWVAAAQAQAVERLPAGDGNRPNFEVPPSDQSASETMAALHAGRDRLVRALAVLTPTHLQAPCPLPFATIPGALALQLIACEYGIHANDLVWALGERAPLPHDVSLATAAILGPALPMLAMRSQLPAPPDGTSFRLAGQTVRIANRRDGDRWCSADEGPWTTTISGDDSTVMLFAMGRVPVDDPGLRVSGETSMAARFKSYFPGP
jgi:uncharacterized protein (TIGR03083 family)